jgi:alpha-beta hydrolase superfamily lysophospholipase
VYPRRMPRPEEIAFRAGEVSLAGELLLPDEEPPTDRRGRYPWVLLLPSWLPRDRDGVLDDRGHPAWFASGPMAPSRPGLLRRLANALADVGVASFRYDVRGCGASGGDWPASDLFTRIDDARDALGAMRARPDLDLARTGIVGHGEGVTIALSVAVGDPAVGALTLIGAPARSGRDVLRRAAASREATGTDRQHALVAALDRASEELIERADRHEPALPLRLRGLDEPVTLALAGWRQAFATPPMALATMLHRSVSLVHGADDVWAHTDEGHLLAATLADAGNDPPMSVLPGIGHDLAGAADAAIAELSRELAARLEPRPLPPVLVALEEMEP